MKKKNLKKYLLFPAILFLALFGGADFSLAAVDKFGGDDRVKNPESNFMTGTADSVTPYTLTDSGAFNGKSLAGSILQPDTAVEFYMLIKGNTDNTITVEGSDDGCVLDNPDCTWRDISDFNSGTENYAVLDRWSVKQIGDRWWLFDPMGNSFFVRAINNFATMDGRHSATIDNIGWQSALNNNATYGGCGTDTAGTVRNYFKLMDLAKNIGFNALGPSDNFYTVPGAWPGGLAAVPIGSSNCGVERPTAINTPFAEHDFMPFFSQIRVGEMALDAAPHSTDSFTPLWSGTVDKLFDPFDPDFQGDIEAILADSATPGGATYYGYRFADNHTYWSSSQVTPYQEAYYNIPANPWFIGFDWAEEDAYYRSEKTNAHAGYYVVTSAAATERKKWAREYLDASYDGATVNVIGKYADVGGLNAAWGTNYATWEEFMNDTGSDEINNTFQTEPYVRDFGTVVDPNFQNETVHPKGIARKADLDGIAEGFFRAYFKKVHDALKNLMAAEILQLGPGLHGWAPGNFATHEGAMSPHYLHRAAVSQDKSETYIDILEIGDGMHAPHTDQSDMLEHLRGEMKSLYSDHGRPYFHESCWYTAEADSAIQYSGMIDGVTANSITDNEAHFDGIGVNETLWPIGGQFLVLIPDVSKWESNRCVYRVTAVSENTLTLGSWKYCFNDANSFPTVFDVRTETEGDADIGDSYALMVSDAIGHIGGVLSYPLYLPLTQEDRARGYVQFLDDMINIKTDGGTYMDVGFANWEFLDFSFWSTAREKRNHGFVTIKGNPYDGRANIANGEVQDSGDFITPVRAKMSGLYNEINGSLEGDAVPPSAPSGLSVI